ncbi:MAG: hypothetical protein JJT76_03980 [Clostridiaceae bacterium]|nr:hypothetical protein [Clostridiaceae bacterium]
MNRVEELKIEIEILRSRLGKYLINNEDFDKMFSLNIMLDKLIVEYHRLTMSN